MKIQIFGMQRRQEEPEIKLDEILGRIKAWLDRFKLGGSSRDPLGLLIFFIFGLAALIWLSTGFYSVQPGERAAIRHFGTYEPKALGAFIGGSGPGLHWYWPAPIGTRNVVSVDEVRRLEIGFRGSTPVLEESLMITGDENIVDVQLLVQYDIKDLEKFLFAVVDPDDTIIHAAAESSLRQIVGQRAIDDVLTTEKEVVQAETRVLLQALLDEYDTGIRVREVRLLNVRPPSQVQDAFDDVVRAREDKERFINLAQAYEADILPRVNGEARRIRELAEAFKQEQVALAEGQSSRFLSVLEEYSKAPDVTRQRLYLEAMEDILPGITKFIVPPQTGSGILPFLPLTGSGSSTTPGTVTP
ncbi:MAG: FtsH protease activity modulator HflK [Chloroflexi bacterium]|nr:FtsH protease activity modulator HflK [Chloroflexota bacterium]